MKASQYHQYGGPEVFQLGDLPLPSPKAHEVLVQVHATTVTGADIMMRTGLPRIGRLYLGLRKPKRSILGFEFAGEVVALGPDVAWFKVGDKVFGGTTKLGCYAEYACVSEKDVITTLPEGISYADAAPVNGSAITAMNFLKGQANLQAGQKVLINGASGAVGSYAVQVAKYLGAEVTAVCSTANIDMVKALGADHVIDYTQADFTRNGQQYDVIFDTVSKRTFRECRHSLTPKGVYMPTVFTPANLFTMLGTSLLGGRKLKSSSTGLLPVKVRLAYFLELKEMMKAGMLRTVIDRHLPLAEMKAAHTYVEQGHKKGNLIIDL